MLLKRNHIKNSLYKGIIVPLLLTILVLNIVIIPRQAKAITSYVAGMECYNAYGISAAEIIYSAAQWYNLNPQVILATLQKEQSLITTPTLNQYGLDWAMGYGVPDSGDRDYSRQGFATQVDWASWQLRWNMDRANDPATRYKVSPYYTGNTITIDSTAVYLGNGATSSLYRYTPHFHGNQNFRTIMNSWWPGSASATWDPSNVILDSVFGDKTTMTQAQIQAFLVSQNSYLANYVYPSDSVIGLDSTKCPAPNVTRVYRFWNTNGTHFYTASETEKNNVIAKWPTIYKLEGVAYQYNTGSLQAPVSLYRFYNVKNGTHFYTASETEKNNIIAKYGYIYQLDGAAYNVSIGGGTPVYRFWNTNGTHFYTASESEKANIIAKWPKTFQFEGIAYYIGS